jgi:hypothetical protein
MNINDIPKEVIDFLMNDFVPNPHMPIIRALHNRLGHHDKGYYYPKDILKYLKISKVTYNKLVLEEFGILDKVHFRKASEIIIRIESALTLEERLYEELLYVLENPKQKPLL